MISDQITSSDAKIIFIAKIEINCENKPFFAKNTIKIFEKFRKLISYYKQHVPRLNVLCHICAFYNWKYFRFDLIPDISYLSIVCKTRVDNLQLFKVLIHKYNVYVSVAFLLHSRLLKPDINTSYRNLFRILWRILLWYYDPYEVDWLVKFWSNL